jgi:hypothetical protein
MVSRFLCGQHISYQGGIRHFQAVARVLEAEENIVVRLQALVDTPNADAERQN